MGTTCQFWLTNCPFLQTGSCQFYHFVCPKVFKPIGPKPPPLP